MFDSFFLFVFSAVTGACFFVFSGALKASSGFLAKTSIVEGENCGNKLHVGCKKSQNNSQEYLYEASSQMSRYAQEYLPMLAQIHN